MQIIKLMGGLGNQMFEYAFGYALSKNNNETVLYDLSWFDEIKNYEGPVAKRIYELGCFNLNPIFANSKMVEKCIDEKRIRVSYFPKFLRKIFKKEKYKTISNKVFEKIINVYEPQLLDLTGDRYFEGYFQCEKYFDKYRNEIIKSFSLKLPLNEKNQEILEEIKGCESISLHVRRGDYVNLQEVHGLCTLDYYKKAIEYIIQRVEKPHFFLFSDDTTWVEQNLKIDYPYTVVNINGAQEGYFDLELMKNCKHNIIANSSFSWWGAWLNENKEKVVIAPSKWFAGENMNYQDIVPESWVKI